MPSPFPGMDPYLESHFWPGFHTAFMVELAAQLQAVLRPRYIVRIEERTYLDTPSDEPGIGILDASVVREAQEAYRTETPWSVEVTVPIPEKARERYLKIFSLPEKTLVTAIELLSPSNKRPGNGRNKYLRKREAVLASHTNFVEIDFLRAGTRMPVIGDLPDYDYSVLICKSGTRKATVYPFTIRHILPTVNIPLIRSELEVEISLHKVFSETYNRSALDLQLDYRGETKPPLNEEDRAWVGALLHEKGVR